MGRRTSGATDEIRQRALSNALSSPVVTNYPAIIAGFEARGIQSTEIKPRENVFTYHAWQALGRQVRKGEHGVKITTWVPFESEKILEDGTTEKVNGKRPKAAVVFHVSQTDERKERGR